MKRIVMMVFCLLMVFLLVVQVNFCYGAKPVTVKLSFTAPQRGQQLNLKQPYTCQGKFQCEPRNTKLDQIHVWLFLIVGEDHLKSYWIQKPVTLKKKDLWEGTIRLVPGTIQVTAVLADPITDKLFKTWVDKGKITKQYELPRGTQFLATVGVKTK